MAEHRTASETDLPRVHEQLKIALEILDNPGGGLVFGYQALGQARALLAETEPERWEEPIRLLAEAEQQAVWRNFDPARNLIRKAQKKLPAA